MIKIIIIMIMITISYAQDLKQHLVVEFQRGRMRLPLAATTSRLTLSKE